MAESRKQQVIQAIQQHLLQELEGLLKAAQAAHEAATSEESRAENQYDTRATEAAYLARAQATRVEEIKRLLTLYRFLPIRTYGKEDFIVPAALVDLEMNGIVASYFIAPQGGGLVMRLGDRPVQVITPQSPIGEVLMGRRVGDVVEVESRGTIREYRVISLE